MSETTKLSALRDDDPYCRYCGIGCCDHVRAQLTEVTRERDDARARIPTGRPDSDRLLLNAYGRECYEAGQQSALAPLRAVVEAAKKLRDAHDSDISTENDREAALDPLFDALDALPADPSAPTPR